MWGEVCGLEGGRGRGTAAGARGAHAERNPTGGFCGAGRAAERTSNIQRMSVALDVSKLSGWLKAYANCRVRKQGM